MTEQRAHPGGNRTIFRAVSSNCRYPRSNVTKSAPTDRAKPHKYASIHREGSSKRRDRSKEGTGQRRDTVTNTNHFPSTSALHRGLSVMIEQRAHPGATELSSGQYPRIADIRGRMSLNLRRPSERKRTSTRPSTALERAFLARLTRTTYSRDLQARPDNRLLDPGATAGKLRWPGCSSLYPPRKEL